MTDTTPSPHAMPPLPAGASRDPAVQAALDAEHLRLLGIAYYIAGGVTAFFSCFFILHFTLFLVLGLNPQFFNNGAAHTSNPPPTGFFLIFAAVIGAIMVLGWIFGALQIYAGRCLQKRKHRIFIFVIAAIETGFIPWGTAIGVWTLIILQRPGMREAFSSPPLP